VKHIGWTDRFDQVRFGFGFAVARGRGLVPSAPQRT
jgi:hypothetical protein